MPAQDIIANTSIIIYKKQFYINTSESICDRMLFAESSDFQDISSPCMLLKLHINYAHIYSYALQKLLTFSH